MARLNALGLDHAQVLCPPGGEAQAREFWIGVVGLAEVGKPQELVSSTGFWLRCGRAGLHIGIEPDFSPSRRAHVAIAVSDEASFDGLVHRLRAAGHEANEASVPVSRRRIKTTDPFGNLVEFVVGSTG